MSEQTTNIAPSGATNEPIIPQGPATEVSEREARPQETPTESYTDKGPITSESWKEKVAKYHKKEKVTADTTPPPESDEPAAPAEEKKPAAAAAAPAEEKKPKAGEAPAAAPAPAAGEFKPNPKYNVMGKEYEIPKLLADTITTPEQETLLKDVFTKVQAFDHVKARQVEIQDKFSELSSQHNEVVDGLDDLKAVYKEAIDTQNPLILNDFFGKLKIPPQVILQYAHAMAQYLELPPEEQQRINGQLNAHRQARETGKQNQVLSSRQFQSEVQARTQALDSSLARPEIASVVSAFDSQPGRKPGDFREQIIRNGVLAWHQRKVDLPIEDNVKEVMALFGMNAAQAPGTTAAPQPQAGAAAQVPAAAATPAPASATQSPAAKPVVPAQPHRNVPTIPSVNGKTSSPTKQGFKSIDELKAHRKEKFGN